jgi:hypothetical protein
MGYFKPASVLKNNNITKETWREKKKLLNSFRNNNNVYN